MKLLVRLILCWVILGITACTSADFKVTSHLTANEAIAFKQRIIHYVAPLAKHATHKTKFEAKYSAHYQEQMNAYRLDKYYPRADGYIYFEVSRQAPSFKIKRVATVGRLKVDADNVITEYEELYRTWKLEEADLEKKTNTLFTQAIKDEDLTKYYTANSTEEYIEFPDAHVTYNKAERRWEESALIQQVHP